MIHTLYDHGGPDLARDLDARQIRAARADAGGVLWVDIEASDATEVRIAIADTLGFPPLIADTCAGAQSPMRDLEAIDQALLVTVDALTAAAGPGAERAAPGPSRSVATTSSANRVADAPGTTAPDNPGEPGFSLAGLAWTPVHLVVDPQVLVTVHATPVPALAALWDTLRDGHAPPPATSDLLAARCLDALTEPFRAAAEPWLRGDASARNRGTAAPTGRHGAATDFADAQHLADLAGVARHYHRILIRVGTEPLAPVAKDHQVYFRRSAARLGRTLDDIGRARATAAAAMERRQARAAESTAAAARVGAVAAVALVALVAYLALIVGNAHLPDAVDAESGSAWLGGLAPAGIDARAWLVPAAIVAFAIVGAALVRGRRPR